MTNICVWLIAEAASILCVIAAFTLAYHDKSGWGWFLVVACLTTVSSYNSTKEIAK